MKPFSLTIDNDCIGKDFGKIAHHPIMASWTYDSEFKEWTFSFELRIPGQLLYTREFTGPSKASVLEDCEHDDKADFVVAMAYAAWAGGSSKSRRYKVKDEEASGSG